MPEWEAAHGIHRSISYGSDDTVTFTYGSAEARTMSLDDFETFVRSRFSGYTIASGRTPYLKAPVQLKPTDSWAVDLAYYSPDGSFAFVRNLWRTPKLGSWSIERTTKEERAKGAPPLGLCWKVDAARDPFASNISNGCMDAYNAITQISGKRPGDVFDLMAGRERDAPGLENVYLNGLKPAPWPDGQPLIAEKAPHD